MNGWLCAERFNKLPSALPRQPPIIDATPESIMMLFENCVINFDAFIKTIDLTHCYFHFQILIASLMIYLDSKMKVQCYAIFLTLAYAASSALADASSSSSPEKGTASLPIGIDTQRVERSPKYDFGLGKRRYIITTGGPGKKRLPHYNFGLGKRSKWVKARVIRWCSTLITLN